jgi:hypothetical protein
MTPRPTCCGEEALKVLAGRNQQRLDDGVEQSTESQPPKAMPLLRFGEQPAESQTSLPTRDPKE